MINWRARLKNKAFWLSLIPALLLLAQQLARLFGIAFDPAGLEAQLTGLTGAIFTILALLGIVVDPTTPGIRDANAAPAAREQEQDNAD